MSNMNNDQESIQFWSSLLHSVADSDPKDDHLSEISSPIMVMSTSMAIDVSPKPFNAPRDGHKAGPQKAIAETGDISIDEGGQRSAEKHIEVIKKEGEKEEIKNFGKNKRPRTNEARNTAEKRRRTDIKTKIENLKQLTPNCKKRDIASTLDCIIDNIRWMKHYVESQSMGPMLPLGMKMDFPAPWFPSIPPNFIMPPFSGFTPGETSCAYGNQNIEPSTTKVYDSYSFTVGHLTSLENLLGVQPAAVRTDITSKNHSANLSLVTRMSDHWAEFFNTMSELATVTIWACPCVIP
ncbi:hypothetical protein HID58_072419 [Brassica napus]|uniref:BHLH domain-containing protein n=1 Tax=Brassica napus TaxID=3708 RepID=A0ABQ7Z4D7_BRANA|nr:hypothetical protein HID58_072419 [Brassica napus]